MSLTSDCYLVGDAVNLFVLLVYLTAHVLSHIFQVANDAAHCIQILLHLILACIVSYPVDVEVKLYQTCLNMSTENYICNFIINNIYGEIVLKKQNDQDPTS